MGQEWIDEGFRQFTVGAAWLRLMYLRNPQSSEVFEDGPKSPLGELISAFVHVEWIPGIRDALQRVWESWPTRRVAENIDFFPKVYQAFKNEYRHATEQFDGQEASQPASEITALFNDCVERHLNPQRAHSYTVRAFPPYSPSREVRVGAWLSQAAALELWSRLRTELKTESSPALQQVVELQQACAHALHPPEEEDQETKGGKLRFWGKTAKKPTRTAEDEALLQRCKNLLERLEQTSPHLFQPATLEEQERIPKYVNKILSTPPTGWPSRLCHQYLIRSARDERLANLSTDLWEKYRQTGEKAFRRWKPESSEISTKLSCDCQARLLFLTLLVNRLDDWEKEAPFSPETWSDAQGLADKLFEDKKDTFSIHLVREAHRPEDAPGQIGTQRTEVKILQTGIIIRNHKGQEKSVQKLETQTIAAPPPLAVSLNELARRVETEHPAVGSECQRWAKFFTEGPDAWWERLETPARGGVFSLLDQIRFLNPANEETLALQAQTFQQCGELGFAYVPVDPGDLSAAEENEVWLVRKQSQGGPQPAVNAAQGEGLLFPDGVVIAPMVWLRARPDWESTTPFQRCLFDLKSSFSQLSQHLTDADWAGWGEFQDLWQLFKTNNVSAWDWTREKEASRAQELLTSTYLLYSQQIQSGNRSSTDPVLPRLAQILRRLRTCLTQAFGADLSPPLLDNLTLGPVHLENVEYLDVTWIKSSLEPGHIRPPFRFGSQYLQGEVKLSAGKMPAGLLAWLELPSPDFSPLQSNPMEWGDHPLVGWYRELAQLPWQADQFPEKEAYHRGQFQSWLDQPAGLTWFNRLIQDLRNRDIPDADKEVARRWWEILVEKQKWCECYPRLSFPEFEHLRWPENVSTEVEGVKWEPHSQIAALHPIEVEVYAPTPQQIRGQFSLGPVVPGSRLAALAEMSEAAREQTSEKVASLCLQFGSMIRDADLLGLKPSPEKFARQVHEMLTALVANGLCRSSSGGDLLKVFEALLKICSPKVRITPKDWLEATLEKVAEGEESDRVFAFDAQLPRGALNLKQFGIIVDGKPELKQRIQVEMVAGAAPVGYYEILEKLQVLGTPEAQALCDHLKNWPELTFQGKLSHRKPKPAENFFLEFYNLFIIPHRRNLSDEMRSLQTLIHRMVEQEPFKFELFTLNTLGQFGPTWRDVVNPSPDQNERSRVVTLRPGWQLEGVMRSKALVEIIDDRFRSV